MGNLNYPDKSYFFGYRGKAKILTFPMMNQTLAKYSKDGFLTLQNFNDCLSVLTFDENFPRLAYTYLSERLFNLIDTNSVFGMLHKLKAFLPINITLRFVHF